MAEPLLFIITRIFLPLTLIFVSLVRPVGLSYLYLLTFFLSPWLLQSNSLKQRTFLNVFMIFLCVLSTFGIVGHIIFNLINLFFVDLSSKNSFSFILRQFGFLYFKGLSFVSIAHWILPDIIVLLNTVAFFIFSEIKYKREKNSIQNGDDVFYKKSKELKGALKVAEINRVLIIVYIRSVLKTSLIFSLIVLYFAATLRPSLPGSLYFCMFIIAGSYWALFRQRKMYYSVIFMIVVLLVHITCIFAYQLPVLQNTINGDKLWTRLMGMEVLIRLYKDNRNGKILELNAQLNLDSYLSPIALMLAYFATTLSLINRSQYEISFNTIRMNLGHKSNSMYANIQPSNEENEEISIFTEPSMLEQLFYIVCELSSFVYKNSYILLNIIMMIWSIVYHSWLTFVFLIWANILWMIPNQRRSMMRSSLFVVCYSQILLLAQYIYGMNLYESELPTKVTSCGLNLEQIGFVHPQSKDSQPWIPLTVKTGFLFVFWVTSRQYFREISLDRQQSDLLQKIFATHRSRSEHLLYKKSQTPQIFTYILKSTSNFITRIWMWLLIFLIFLCAMIDRTMTGFRICYMSLFLLFLMVFQMSLQLWIRFLYGYWIFLIFYAMTILTAIYTYQFDHFDYYWEKFLKVQSTLQCDIGLRRYQTKDLFLHLLIPTLTVIFTVVQLHYFHRRFVESVRRPRSTEGQNFHLAPNAKTRASQKTLDVHRQSWKVFFDAGYENVRGKGRQLFNPGKIVAWKFLEMHMIKTVTLASFYCAISEICFLNVFLVILSLLGICGNRFLRRVIFRAVTFWISLLVLMKMIYQIKYLDQSHYNFKCGNVTVNFAEWMGLRKTGTVFGVHLRYISPYIIYMILTSLHAVVKLRDHLIRYSTHKHKDTKLLFPDITRQDAERDFPGLLKYVLNYGYFKFGFEITMIGLMSTIAHRRDLLALTYLIWLVILLCLSRFRCARIWEMLQLYFVLSIFVQYVYLLNFPPNLCNVISYNSLWSISDSKHYTNRSNIMFDYIVLLLISRQRKSFRVEMRHINDLSYRGGVNNNVVNNIAKLGHVYFENPTHDFCTYVRNYADVLKTAIFFSFFWITLAIVFLGGVCSTDILSLGYIIFALIFLLQGSEIYLQNIHFIICRWNCLIAFNIFNIIVKVAIIVLEGTINLEQKSILSIVFNVMHQTAPCENLMDGKMFEINDISEKKYCYGPSDMIFKNTLVWHAIIFSFVVFQYRIFRSYYFCHVIMDTQANTILASRGAAIIENLHYKQIYDRRKNEQNVLESVKMKMEHIRITNRRHEKQATGLDFQAPSSIIHVHYRAEENSKLKTLNDEILTTIKQAERDTYFSRSLKPRRRDLSLHPHAVRTGDYYMFNELDDDDDLDVYEEYDFLEKEDIRARQMRQSLRSKASNYNRSKSFLYDENSDSDNKKLETHPVIILTSELIILLTFRLNRLSKNFRFVHKMLSAEKKKLQNISIMNRLGLSNTAAMFKFLNKSLNNNVIKEAGSDYVSQDNDFTTLDHNDFVQMLIALWYALIANTEAICYLVVFLNQAANSSVISLPMPFLVLCWGALTLPRPSKTFWVTLITYSLTMIFLKSIMHQRVLLDQQLISRSNSLSFELIMKRGRAVYDLFLLVVLFWHQYMLKKQGIWTIQRTNSELLLLEKKPSHYKRSFSKERPENIRQLLREEGGGGEQVKSVRPNAIEFKREMDDMLLPVLENKYVYQNIESEYYRKAMQGLANKGGLLSGFRKFFLALRHKSRLSTDVYTLLFLCDFISFFILLFGFPKFVYRYKYSTSVLETYIQGNKVPFTFLLMLIVQFITIVTERAIYLRKALIYKICFHFISVLGIHIWMFFLVPYITSHSFGETAPVLFYLIKCLHMLLSAYQIRCGYPKRILGNVFTKGYSLANYIAFKIYMEIPFLYILRTMLDWVCIDTTLTVMEWIKMEDIFQSVFIVRCYRQMDTDFPVLRGEPKALYSKLLIGGTIILILIALIWSPLFLFALVGTVGKPNIPQKADIAVKINHYEPIYVSQSNSDILQFSNSDLQKLTNRIILDNYASDSMMLYDAVDVTAIKFYENSISLWNMPPPDKERLLHDLSNGAKLDIHLTLTLKCNLTPEAVIYETTYTLTENKVHTRDKLIRLMSADFSNEKVIVPNILPKFITVQRQQANAKFIKDYDALLSATLRTYQKAACDSDQVVIACPRGTSISIEFAQYNKFVAKDGYSIEELCPGSGEIRSEIRGRTKHLLRGSIFGSPPLKTPSSKYVNAGHSLAVPVQPVPESNSSSSESISSMSPSVDDIQSTDYTTDNASENCMWPNALQYSLLQTVVEACQKKKHCKFHGSPEFYGQGSSGVGDSSGTSSYHSSTASSNAISSDPCPKRKKIVEVAYKCRPYEFRSKVACHNDVAQLECNPYSRIAVYSASFGRTEYESIQCPQPQGVREETCLASYATETVMQICHGRRRCNLAADANTFGSPCQPNSRMYLKVVYTCVPKQVLKENKALEVEADEPEDFGGDLNDLYDDELIYKESEAIPKLYSNTTTTVRRNGTRSLGFEFSVNSANNQSMTNSSLVVEGDRSGVNPVMTHSADLSLEEDQERLYFYLLVLVSLGVLISIAIFGTRIALQKHRLITETLSSSLAKTTRRAVEETTIPSGFNDTISEIDAEIDLKTTLPLPSLSKENYLTYAPTSSLYADLPCNQLVSACSPGSAAGQIGKPHMVGSRQSPDLIGITPGPFVTTSMAGLGGPMAGMVTSAIVIGDSTPSSSSLGTMIPITQYTTAPTIRGGYVISAENMGVIQRANNTPTPLNLLSGSTPEHPPQAGPIISAGAMNVTPQAHGPISAGGASKLRRVKPPFLQPQLSYDGTAPRTLSTGVAVGSQFYYG